MAKKNSKRIIPSISYNQWPKSRNRPLWIGVFQNAPRDNSGIMERERSRSLNGTQLDFKYLVECSRSQNGLNGLWFLGAPMKDYLCRMFEKRIWVSGVIWRQVNIEINILCSNNCTFWNHVEMRVHFVYGVN